MPSLWVRRDGEMVPLEQEGHHTEDAFQRELADNPALLASAIDADGDWILIARELRIQVADVDGVGYWRLDHLFIDSQGVPTLVEVKQSGDPRARREVVAQMLDYAASFATDWDARRLRQLWLDRLAEEGEDCDEHEVLTTSPRFETAEEFWDEVQTRIDAGRIRLLFVADRLSGPLVRIIEYLNEQLRDVEVLGVEVVRHVGGEPRLVAFQPVVRGRTMASQRSKSSSERRTQGEFEAVLLEHHGQAALESVQALVARAEALEAFVSIGRGERSPRLFLNFPHPTRSKPYWPLAVNPRPGKVVLFLRYLAYQPAFEDEQVRADYVDRMAQAIGKPLHGADRLGGFPFFDVEELTDPARLDAVTGVLAWVVSQVEAEAATTGGPPT